jgi:hypothetical protein
MVFDPGAFLTPRSGIRNRFFPDLGSRTPGSPAGTLSILCSLSGQLRLLRRAGLAESDSSKTRSSSYIHKLVCTAYSVPYAAPPPPPPTHSLRRYIASHRTGPTSRIFKRQSLGPPPAPLAPPSSSSKAANLERSLRLLDSALGSPATAAPAGGQLNISNYDVTRAFELTRPIDFLGGGRVERHN